MEGPCRYKNQKVKTMNPITKIDNLLDPSSTKASPTDQTLQVLEKFIDKLVTATNKRNKAAAEEAVRREKIRAEHDKKVAYLQGQLRASQLALASLEESVRQAQAPPEGTNRVSQKRDEVVYWRSRLHEVQQPEGL